MALGDLLSATVRATGWEIDLVFEGFSTGATYSFGYTGSSVPGASTPSIAVTRQGYNASKVLGTVADTVYLVRSNTTDAERKPYPNQTVKQETGGGNLTVRIALSDLIYQGDTSPLITIPAGFVTSGGTPNNAAASVAVTNSSTRVYNKVIGHFAIEQRRPLNGTAKIEVFVAHKYARNGKPVANVTVTATGATSGHTETGEALVMTKSSRADSLPVYEVQLNLSTAAGFTRGELVNINFTAYPWVGDATSILDATADAGAKVYRLGPLKYAIMDKMICVVDPSGGNDGTAVASTVQATANANPAQTIQGAITAIAAANNSVYSLNRIDGGEVQLKAGTYAWTKGSQTCTNGYLTITPHSSTNRAGVIFGSAGAVYQYKYTRFYNVTITRAAANYIWYGAVGDTLILEAVNMADSQAQDIYDAETDANIEYLDCVSNTTRLVAAGTTSNCRLNRNYTLTPTTEGANAQCGTAQCILGARTVGGATGLLYKRSFAGANNYVVGYCICYAGSDELFIRAEGAVAGLAIVQCIFERVGAAGQPIAEISDSDGSSPKTNVILQGNTFPGQRFNHENNITTAVNGQLEYWSARFNTFDSRGDHRDDIRLSDASMIGSWSVGYSVGWSDNHNEGRAYTGDTDFWGIRSNLEVGSVQLSSVVPAGFTADRSKAGTDAGSGDYTPAVGSVLRSRIPAGRAAYPYDVFGTAILNNGGGAIGAVQPAPAAGAAGSTRNSLGLSLAL